MYLFITVMYRHVTEFQIGSNHNLGEGLFSSGQSVDLTNASFGQHFTAAKCIYSLSDDHLEYGQYTPVCREK